mmetsp:Transcript_51752/g.123163  ORF Transcript_51752/g.123163 Transcript_51752/m.123163 type:complete len:224 (+) Transcript_51752:57-728(+)
MLQQCTSLLFHCCFTLHPCVEEVPAKDGVNLWGLSDTRHRVNRIGVCTWWYLANVASLDSGEILREEHLVLPAHSALKTSRIPIDDPAESSGLLIKSGLREPFSLWQRTAIVQGWKAITKGALIGDVRLTILLEVVGREAHLAPLHIGMPKDGRIGASRTCALRWELSLPLVQQLHVVGHRQVRWHTGSLANITLDVLDVKELHMSDSKWRCTLHASNIILPQ